ncbi:hypothetical protein Ciccas_004104 [Cichlidogyrus casuarinus]|uniref:26S proteasome complex subunit SEM1 n=1 Tax=Cichlidogyrus casuarinus TaxID=1844966 RepID=A0ABD2QCJ6_9PLAT
MEISKKAIEPIKDKATSEAVMLEDDTFEEFPTSFTVLPDEPKLIESKWEDDWFNDNNESKYSALLRMELEKQNKKLVIPNIGPPRV